MPNQFTGPENLASRFWSKVQKSDEGCWEWVAGRNHDGYGKFYLNGSSVNAHRIAYELTHGPIDRGQLCLHICDNRACCRPDHLCLGTPKENSEDMVRKGRSAAGNKHWTKTSPGSIPHGSKHGSHTKPERFPRGSSHGMSKLTEEGVRTIRLMKSDGLDQIAIAAHFNVTPTTIAYVLKGKTWKHVV